MALSDIILLGVILLAAVYGWRMGTINVVAKIGAYLLGYRLSRYLSPYVAQYFAQSFPRMVSGGENEKLQAFFSLFFNSSGPGGFLTRILEMIAFVVVFTASTWLIRKAAFAMTGIFSRGLLGRLNRAIGAFLAALIALALIMIVADVILPALTGLGMNSAALDFFNNSSLVMPLLRNLQNAF